MRILIVGSDSNAYTLARAFSKDENVDVVFVTSGNKYITDDFAQTTDISETDNDELLDFVVANEISLTVVTSLRAIENDIAGYFNDFRRNIFAPAADSAFAALYRSACKKALYKLRVPTIKFGIFDRENQAVNYVSDIRKTYLIKNDSNIINDKFYLVNSFSKAKSVIEKEFMQPETKIVIEDFTEAKEVFLYFITDGYSVLPIGSCSLSDDSSFSVFSPDNILSDNMFSDILNRVVYPYIDYCSSTNRPYCGIFGVDMLVEDDEYKVIEFYPFFKQIHLQSILPLISENLSEMLLSVAVGSFSDDYGNIKFKNKCSFSQRLKLMDNNKITEYDDDNLSYSYDKNGNVILTETARTYSRSKEFLDCAIMYLTSDNNKNNSEVSNEKNTL